jgi:hypothetical protein
MSTLSRQIALAHLAKRLKLETEELLPQLSRRTGMDIRVQATRNIDSSPRTKKPLLIQLLRILQMLWPHGETTLHTLVICEIRCIHEEFVLCRCGSGRVGGHRAIL